MRNSVWLGGIPRGFRRCVCVALLCIAAGGTAEATRTADRGLERNRQEDPNMSGEEAGAAPARMQLVGRGGVWVLPRENAAIEKRTGNGVGGELLLRLPFTHTLGMIAGMGFWSHARDRYVYREAPWGWNYIVTEQVQVIPVTAGIIWSPITGAFVRPMLSAGMSVNAATPINQYAYEWEGEITSFDDAAAGDAIVRVGAWAAADVDLVLWQGFAANASLSWQFVPYGAGSGAALGRSSFSGARITIGVAVDL